VFEVPVAETEVLYVIFGALQIKSVGAGSLHTDQLAKTQWNRSDRALRPWQCWLEHHSTTRELLGSRAWSYWNSTHRTPSNQACRQPRCPPCRLPSATPLKVPRFNPSIGTYQSWYQLKFHSIYSPNWSILDATFFFSLACGATAKIPIGRKIFQMTRLFVI
jgi:hypothetical protein